MVGAMSCDHIIGYKTLEPVYGLTVSLSGEGHVCDVFFGWCPLCGEALTEEAKKREQVGRKLLGGYVTPNSLHPKSREAFQRVIDREVAEMEPLSRISVDVKTFEALKKRAQKAPWRKWWLRQAAT